MTWHSRGYLPHWEAGEVPQSITFRLADSLPRCLLERWRVELTGLDRESLSRERRIRIEHALDVGAGSGELRDPQVARIVEEALFFGDGERYRLHAWVIMPNHVHVLITPLNDATLSSILQGWKSVTSRRMNVMFGRKGKVWAREYFDRVVRNQDHYDNVIAYIADNPVHARLCGAPAQWRFSSSWNGSRER